jgi:hypothetical protein
VVWCKVLSALEQPEEWKKAKLERALHSQELKEGDDPGVYLKNSLALIDNCCLAGILSAKDSPGRILIAGLPNSWQPIVRGLEHNDKLSLQHVVSAIQQEAETYAELKRKRKVLDDQVHNVDTKPTKRMKIQCNVCQRPNHSADKCFVNPDGMSFQKIRAGRFAEKFPELELSRRIRLKLSEATEAAHNSSEEGFRGLIGVGLNLPRK